MDNDDLNQYSMMHGMRIRLLMLGSGTLLEDMKKLAEKLRISDRCIFAGNKSNASDYYQAMDYFCFPSRYEGLPGSVIEAQAAGLQCLVSDTVTPEVNVTELVSMRSINSEPRDWARKILDDLMLREDYHQDPLEEEIRVNETFTRIAGERRESVFEQEDAPDIDALDAGTGFDAINIPVKSQKTQRRAIEFSIGDRSQSSDYIIGKLRAAGFDVRSQAKMMKAFYERGRF
ncbi:MAG: glycosyltransferase [Butyrivibrio sp.]|nr:glycosyltransferase [Butyrivibrio sp.]